MPQYKVLVDDNFHYLDEDERWTLGTYDTIEEAIDRCKKVVELSLEEGYKPGITPESLYAHYISYGDDPFIVPLDRDDRGANFSAWDYSRERCRSFCEERRTRELSTPGD